MDAIKDDARIWKYYASIIHPMHATIWNGITIELASIVEGLMQTKSEQAK